MFIIFRFILTQYLVVIWAINGVRSKKMDDENVPQEIKDFVLAILIIILYLICFCSKVKSKENSHRLQNLRSKLFYNPLIRYAILNSLKFNLTAVTTFQLAANDLVQVTTAVSLLVLINGIPLVLSRTLFRLNNELHTVDNIKKFGSMYSGRNVSPKRGRHLAWIGPLVFFYRRKCLKI